MNLIDAIKGRRSIRQYAEKLPPRKLILECLDAATWAPSPTNQQPWEFVVVGGAALEKISRIIADVFPQRMRDLDPYRGIPEACERRKTETFSQLLAAAQSAGLDAKAMFQKNMSFYGAPLAVLFVIPSLENNLYRYAAATAVQNFLLAAHAGGLGTCWLSSVAAGQDELKSALDIAPGKEIFDGVALGYPVEEAPLNNCTRTRMPARHVTTWVGFEE